MIFDGGNYLGDIVRQFGYPVLNQGYSGVSMMPLYIKDDTTANLVGELARLRGISKQDAVKLAVKAELRKIAETVPLRDRFSALRTAHPLPPATGKAADKAFFDDLSGGL